MVHHGYQRPGHGSIVGDCPGVGEVPYEVSCDLVKSYRTGAQTQLQHLKAKLADLKAGKIGYLTEIQHRSAWKPPVRVEFVAGVTDSYHWTEALQHAIYEVDSSIRQCEREIDRCTRRIDAWTPKPIRTLEEEKVKQDADKAGRKALRDAARAIRLKAAAARKAKAEALVAKRLAIQEEFEAKLCALAENKKAGWDPQYAARAILAELNKTKYRNWLRKWDLRCTDALIALGLAVQEDNGNNRPYLRFL
jgi:predicted  nucleic acid-binding Zn-ribbon protein